MDRGLVGAKPKHNLCCPTVESRQSTVSSSDCPVIESDYSYLLGILFLLGCLFVTNLSYLFMFGAILGIPLL